MRPLLLSILLGLTTITAAQIQRGDHLLTLDGEGAFGAGNTAAVPLLAGNIGGLIYIPEYREGLFYTWPTYGFALTNRLVLGSGFGFAAEFGEYSGASYTLSPYLRYYGINRPGLGIYAEARTQVTYAGGTVYAADPITLGAGLQLPLAAGIRFGPTINYVVQEYSNYVQAGARLELVLGRNNRPADTPAAGFRKGSVMLGGQLVSATLRRKFRTAGVTAGGHYFLTDRLTAAVNLGVEDGYREYGRDPSLNVFRWYSYSLGLSSRYYLTTQRQLVYFVEAGGGYERSGGSVTTNDVEDRSSHDGSLITVAAGAQFFIRDRVALEAGPQYRRVFDTDATYGVLAVNFGARFLL